MKNHAVTSLTLKLYGRIRNALAHLGMYSIVAIGLSGILFSCEDDPSACEMGKTGTFVIENGHADGSLQVHFNKTRIGANSLGDLSLKPGEKGSMELPVGKNKVVAILIVSNCIDNRCMVQTSTQNDSEEDLSQCETRNLVF